MSDEYGIDREEVFRVIDAAEVLVVRFHLIQKRLLVDFRSNAAAGPLVAVVPRAESIEERFRSIRRLRPQFPMPERVMSFQWPRTIGTLLASGVWQHIVDRIGSIGGPEAVEACGKAMQELLAEERREVIAAIRGAAHYQTLWAREEQ